MCGEWLALKLDLVENFSAFINMQYIFTQSNLVT